MKKCLIIITLAVIAYGCGKRSVVGPSDYIQLVRKNSELSVNREIKAMKFVCRYRSMDEMIISETGGTALQKEKYIAVADKYKDLVYFNFLVTLEKNEEIINQRGQEAYYQMLDYFSNRMQGDFYMVVKDDTIPCTAYYYERNFDLSPHNNISLAFQSKKLVELATNSWKEDAIIVYDDKILGTGPLNFRFNKVSINELPILDYEKN